MIPFNLSEVGGGDLTPLISRVQSDEILMGSASPAEIVTFLIALIIAYVGGLFATYYLKRIFSHRIKRDHLDFWITFIRILLVLAAIAITVPPLFDAGLLIVFLILIGSVAILALAGQNVLANVVAGIVIMYERPFARGDFITIGNTSGTVVSISLFTTLIRTEQGVLVHVPNEEVYTGATSNYHTSAARRFDYNIGIRYKDDTTRAISIITDIVDRYTFALSSPAPEIFVSDLGESHINIRIRVWFPSSWANTQDDVSLRTALLPSMKSALEAAGIEVPFPQRTLWFANEPGRR